MSKNTRDFIEQKLYEQFHSSESNVPEQLWDQIEESLDKKDDGKKRPFIFIYFFIFFICAGLGRYILVHQESLFAQNRPEGSGHTPDLAAGLKDKVNVSDEAKMTLNDPKRNQNSGGGKMELKKTSDSIENDDSSESSLNNTKIKTSSKLKRKQNITSFEDLNSNSEKSTNNIKTKVENQLDKNPHPQIDSRTAAPADLNNNVNNSRSIDASSLISSPEAIALKTTEAGEIVAMCLPEFDYNDRPVFRRVNPLQAFASLSFGLGYSRRDIAVNRSESFVYKNREATEIPYYNVNVALSAGILINKRWTISTGLELLRCTEKFSYEKKNAAIVDSFGRIAHGVLKITGPIYHSLINIPVDLGFEHRLGKWKVGLEAGVSINLWSRHTGKILFADQDIRLIEDNPGIYRTNLGMQLRMACMVNKNLDNKTTIFLKPRITKYMETWTMPSHPSQISYHMIDLNIGIRRLF